MKSKSMLFSISVAVLCMGIILVIVFKFVLKREDSFAIYDIDNMYVVDFDGNEIKFSSLLNKNESTYCVIFKLEDCSSCILNGVEDLKTVEKNGKKGFGLVVHDYIDDVKGWANHYKKLDFYILKPMDFIDNIKSPSIPVFIKLKENKVESFRYIRAN